MRKRKTSRKAKPASTIWTRRLKTYGITRAQFYALLNKQGGCGICKTKSPKPVKGRADNWTVDHDHLTGKVRGVLCHPCNKKLSVLEDQKFVKSARRYLLA